MPFSSSPSYKDHSGERLLFSDAIAALGRDRYGSEWISPSPHPPMRLPDLKETASDEEQAYAAWLLRRDDPSLIIEQVNEDFDDSLPSSLRRRFELNIDPFHWGFAVSLAASGFDSQILALHQLSDLLTVFAVSAAKGITKCHSRELGTFEDKELEPSAWQVDIDELKARFTTDLIVWIEQRYRSIRSTIIVERCTLPFNEAHRGPIQDVKETIVRNKLKEARQWSEIACPHGNIRTLRRDIAGFMACDTEKVSLIIHEETNGCWSKSGRKGGAINPVRVTPETGNS